MGPCSSLQYGPHRDLVSGRKGTKRLPAVSLPYSAPLALLFLPSVLLGHNHFPMMYPNSLTSCKRCYPMDIHMRSSMWRLHEFFPSQISSCSLNTVQTPPHLNTQLGFHLLPDKGVNQTGLGHSSTSGGCPYACVCTIFPLPFLS